MDDFRFYPTQTVSREDSLSLYRDRIMYPPAVIAVICFLPFMVNNFIRGRYALGTIILITVIILATDAVAIYRKKAPPIPYWILMIPASVAITLSLRTQGIYGAFWCYPLVVFFYFVLSRRMANACTVALLLLATFTVNHYLGPNLSIRFFASLTLTIAVVNIILKIIVDLQNKLVEQAIKDPLTDAFNRRHMESCLSEAVERRQRHNIPATLLLLDIDNFKQINDQFGHAAGDRVLKDIVSIIENRARKLDLLFRLGGEEFILFMPDSRESSACTLAEDLRKLIADSRLIVGRPVTVSIGVSELQTGQLLDAWIKQADDALYVAKKSGRNRVHSKHMVHLADELRLVI
jgi:diguanylate cyclase (GGDEF)-like protein